MRWILLIWLTTGSATAPAVPIKVDEYNTQADCNAAADIWRANKETHRVSDGVRNSKCLDDERFTRANGVIRTNDV